MKKLVVFGEKKFAEMVYYQFTCDSEYEVVAFTVDSEFISNTEFKGLPIIAYDQLANHFDKEDIELFVAIGIDKLNQLREKRVNNIMKDGYTLASFVSSKAILLGSVDIGHNVMIMEGTIIHPNTTIGQNCILWSGTKIAMYNQIEDNCWVTSATIGENCVIGANTFIGLNATISPNVRLGKRNVIGAAALICKNTLDEQVFKGVRSQLSKVRSPQLARLAIIK